MKYLYTGLGILAVCLLLCLVMTAALSRYTAEAAAQLEQARLLGESGSFEQAARWVGRASDNWRNRKGFFGVILPHDHLDEVDSAFRKAQAYARDANDSEFGPTCVELIDILQNMSEMETPHYYNVF